jgi:hypothetical protein
MMLILGLIAVLLLWQVAKGLRASWSRLFLRRPAGLLDGLSIAGT